MVEYIGRNILEHLIAGPCSNYIQCFGTTHLFPNVYKARLHGYVLLFYTHGATGLKTTEDSQALTSYLVHFPLLWMKHKSLG